MDQEANVLERAYGLAEAAMAHAWAVEEALMEFVIESKHPEGLPVEEWRQKMAVLRERLHGRAAELLREVQTLPLRRPIESPHDSPEAKGT
jgi:hypothetical protein